MKTLLIVLGFIALLSLIIFVKFDIGNPEKYSWYQSYKELKEKEKEEKKREKENKRK